MAAWGWIASPARRFHISYLSGLALIIAGYAHLRVSQRPFERQEYPWPDWYLLQLLLEGPILAWFTATLGLVLILAALIQDRR